MTLIAKAGKHGGLGERLTGANESASQCDPPLDDVGMRSQSELTRESSDQLAIGTCDSHYVQLIIGRSFERQEPL